MEIFLERFYLHICRPFPDLDFLNEALGDRKFLPSKGWETFRCDLFALLFLLLLSLCLFRL